MRGSAGLAQHMGGQGERELRVELQARDSAEVLAELHGQVPLLGAPACNSLQHLRDQVHRKAAAQSQRCLGACNEAPEEGREGGAAEAKGQIHETDCCVELANRQTRPNQQRVAPHVGPHAAAAHAAQHLQTLVQVAMRCAGMHEVGIDVDVGLQAVLLRKLLHHLEGLVWLLGAVRELHEDGQRERAGADAHGLHLLEELHALVVEALLGATVD
mmetsp:Transcript_1424/g.4610  ORF Transcript_1424/g.4610 Transcript_1424/m.4610 type:complete len:215 (+) Transcript_1424:100-744(+)